MAKDEVTSDETTEEVTVQETSSEEVETEEPSPASQETEEETSEEETSEEQSSDNEDLYAGKYKSVQALEEAYRNVNSETSAMAKELSELRRVVEDSKLTYTEKQEKKQTEEFVKTNDLLTKAEYLQIQRDEREAAGLLAKGVKQHQLDRVKEVSRYGKYAKMSVTEIYTDLYGPVPKQKPTQSAKQRPKSKGGKGQYTPQEIKNMSKEEFQKNYKDILARGVAS